MDLFSNLAMGMGVVFEPTVLMYCLLGVTLGTLIGVLPGIGPLTGISLLLPMTFHLDPTTAVVMLAGVYYGSQYGGSTASILLNIAGTASSAVVCLEGYPMAQKGRAGVALFLVALCSFFGSVFGIVILAVAAPTLAAVALKFSAPEYFALMVLGLVAASLFSSGSQMRGIASVVLGMFVGVVGMDVVSGQFRFTFGSLALSDGVDLVAIALGLFGVAEVISAATSGDKRGSAYNVSLRSMIPTRQDMKEFTAPSTRGSIVGSVLGILPGAGPTISSFLAYTLEQRTSRNPGKFRKGAIEGLVAPEAANNAAAQTGFVPTLTLGIPGDPVMALILGALVVHGITPGPVFIQENPTMFWGLIASFLVGNVMLLVLNIPMIGIWVRLLSIPAKYLYPGVIALICVGVYSINRSTTDILVVLACGLIGYGMRLLRFDSASVLLGLVMGPMIEESLRRSMIMARGDLTGMFAARPIALVLLLTATLMVAWMVYATIRRNRSARRAA